MRAIDMIQIYHNLIYLLFLEICNVFILFTVGNTVLTS